MPYMLIEHRVMDFGKWKPVYDEHAGARRDAGLEDVHLLRDAEDPNRIVLLFRSTDSAKARAFAESTDLRNAMQRAGVVGRPDIRFLDEG